MSNRQNDMLRKLAELKVKEEELQKRLVSPRHIAEDVTSERLAELMEQNGEEMMSCSTDARGACKTLFGKYRSGNAGDEDPYIKGFSGDRLNQDRIGRAGASLLNPILSVAWCVQLDKFDEAYQSQTLRDSGFLARCLPCRVDWNSSAPKYDNDSGVEAALCKFDQTICELFDRYHVSTGKPQLVTVEQNALEVLTNFDRRLRQLINDGTLARERIFVSRWGELAFRIALIFHCAAHGTNAHTMPLDKSTAENAVEVMRWFGVRQLGLLGVIQQTCENDKLAIALPFVNRSGHGGVSARDLYRHKQTLFEDSDDALATLEELEAEHAIEGRWVRKSRRFFRRTLPGEKVIGIN